MSLSREWIVAAKARADAATDGPWWRGEIQRFSEASYHVTYTEVEPAICAGVDVADAEFIASAREDVPVMADALLRVLDRETVARAIRDRVRLGPIGPNSAAIIAADGRVSLTASEADDAADAVLDVLYGVAGSSSNTERSEQ